MRFSITRAVMTLTVATLAAILIGGCGSTATPTPPIVYPSQYQWHDEPPVLRFVAPTTAQSPGPAVTFSASHRLGLGPAVSNASLDNVLLMSQISQSVTLLLRQESSNLHATGWRALFVPTPTGSYPTTVVYDTFQSGSHYCFVEYSATIVASGEASQQLDVYYD